MPGEHDVVSGIEPILLRDGLVLGRSSEAGVLLPDSSVSRRHLVIHGAAHGWELEDLGSKSGSFLNGRIFQRKELILGDVLSIGPFVFRFDGLRLCQIRGAAGAELQAVRLTKRAGETTILDGVSLQIDPGLFVGVIGPSGAGKSSLLDALCALRPAHAGDVYVDGRNLYENYELLRDEFGYVPQDDIVPLDLTVEQALLYSARLRLPRTIPLGEIQRLVVFTIGQLGLEPRAHARVARLSGGQRKRVSVAAELLCRPRLLFLDEPTSGLDPAAESNLMELLRRLAANGCTIVCTTHVMENAHLMDRLAVMNAGRLVFFDEPSKARDFFGVEHLVALYDRLEENPEAWQSIPETPRPPSADAVKLPPKAAPAKRPAALPILLLREWAVLRSDWKNLFLLAGQPVLIGILVTWVSTDASLILFFAYIATLWFGCGNAAQEIVKELPMYRRERLIGLPRGAYLSSKFLSLARITVIQSLLLYAVMQVAVMLLHTSGQGVAGSASWQAAGLVATCFASVGMGLAISALARSVLQAVMLVPLVLIPQILFSGFVPPAGDMSTGPYVVSRLMPSAAVQSVMDVSVFWKQKITGFLHVDYPSAFSNLNRDKSLKNGFVFENPRPAIAGLAALGLWTAGSLAVAWGALRAKERG